jgi:polar amino acid transport system substrate-binding protein
VLQGLRRGCNGWLSRAIVGGLLVLLVTIGGMTPVWAAPLKVATRMIPPFVQQDDKQELTGFSVNLWQKIAQQTQQEYQFQTYNSLPEMLNAVKNGQADAAIAAISITSEREKQFDFSYPMFASGLQIMVRHPKQADNIFSAVREIFSPLLGKIMGIALSMVLVAAHVVWLLERGHAETMISRRYWPGIIEALWWAVAALAAQAEQMPRSVLGRIMAIVWMFTSILFIAYFTATFTTVLTVQKLQGDVQSLQDLVGRKVATTAGSTAADFLRKRQLKTVESSKIEDSYQALLTKQADAVVFDAPVLMYYVVNQGQGEVMLVGETFRDENYGIVLPSNSPNRKGINNALLTIKENGTYQELYDRWFKSKT